jgi:hypothetical protein
MTGYEQFQQIMAEINYRKNMEENRKNFGSNYDLFENIFNKLKI